MKVLIVYCHPSKKSFTNQVKEKFIKGLIDAGHSYMVSDLYESDFNGELSEAEYLRETYYQADQPVSRDVQLEQDKIQQSDAIVFIYPVFWTEAPAKLVGWFDRVWTSGFAYTPHPTMKTLKKVFMIAVAGKTQQALDETGEAQAMRTVMLGDRIRDRAIDKEMVLLDGITHWEEELRNSKMKEHLKTAYQLGLGF
ncbi:NAD(P)H oxidoreductase YRKL [Lachnospiraceae bacterium KM106-2]|nr:NAD(P)H oxidoreductase YRKL [Lachnospiraceae bacterium KM106-2]